MQTIKTKFSKITYKNIGLFVFIVLLFTGLTYPIAIQINRGDIILYILFSFSIWYTLLIVFVKDFVAFIKIAGILFILFFMLLNITSLYYLIHIALTTNTKAFKITILSFIALFYGSFLRDFFIKIQYIKYYTNEYQKNLLKIIKKYPIKNGVIYIQQSGMPSIDIKEKRKMIYPYIAGAFFIPFVLLGKGASYFLLLEISRYYSAHAFMLASMLVPGTLFFIQKTISNTLALWKLKYPLQEFKDSKEGFNQN